MITVVMVDDHQIVRRGVHLLLSSEPDMRLAGEAEDGLAGLELVQRLLPTVLLVDLMMPGISGLEVVRQVSQRHPQVRTLVFSMCTNEADVLQALRNGASGYLLKSCSGDELIPAIRRVALGGHYLDSHLSERAIAAYIEKACNVPDELRGLLTAREREVLQLSAAGITSNKIAERLSISPYTATTHRANLMRKLNLHNQSELVRFAMQQGILSYTP